MSDNRNAMLSVLADAQRQMHQLRVRRALRSDESGRPQPPQSLQNSKGADRTAANSSSNALVVSSGTTAASGNALVPHVAASRRVRSVNYIGARDDRDQFFEIWSRRIEDFVSDSTQVTMDLPDELDSNDRRVLHSLAEKFNLAHMSAGKGTDRHLVLKKDALFYRAANAVIDRDAIEALKKKQEEERGSRFRLKRVQGGGVGEGVEPSTTGTMFITDGSSVDDLGLGEENSRLQKALRALDSATNQYAYATDQDASAAPTSILGGIGSVPLRPMIPAESEANKYLSSRAGVISSSDAANNAARAAAVPAQAPAAPNTSSLNIVSSSWRTAIAQHNTAAPSHSSSAPVNAGAGHGPSSPSGGGGAVLKDVVTYEEQCTGCGTSSVLDYEVDQWTCIGHCDTCGREAVFRLIEKKKRVVVAATPSSNVVTLADNVVQATSEAQGARVGDENAPVIGQKRPREGDYEEVGARNNIYSASPSASETATVNTVSIAPAQVEEIEKEAEDNSNTNGDDDDDDVDAEELIALETDDLVSMLECNDYHPSLINWLRAFATGPLGGDCEAIGARIQLVMELTDVPKRVPGASVMSKRTFCKIVGDGPAVVALMDEVWRKGFSASSDIVIGLPNMSVAGMETEVVLHGPASVVDEASLVAIRERVGSKHFVFGSTLASVV